MPKQKTRRNPVDEIVGMQIQRRRKVLGITEILLAEVLELTLIEYQECETGERRIGAAGLLKLAKLLNVSPSFFFEGDPLDAAFRGGSTLQ